MKRAGYLIILLSWVLWTRTQGPAVDDWTGVAGFSTEQQCLANQKEKLDTWKQFKDAKFNKNTVVFTGNNTSMTYLCLPESQDPRTKPQTKGAR
jgi:hypothetical protein